MFINEDFFDDINTEQISTDDVEDISLSSVDLSLYKTVLTVSIVKPNNIKLEDLKTYIKRLSYILSASSMTREISEPCIKEVNTLSKNSFLSNEDAYKLDEYHIYFGIRLSVNSLTKFYNLLNFIFNKLNPNTSSPAIIFKIEFIDKSTTVPYLYFLNTDFSYNRREEDFIKRISAFCKQYLRTEFDYNELKKCMGLDTIKQLTHISLSDYDDWSIKEIKLFNESHQTDNLPREFFFKCKQPKFFAEPSFEKFVVFGNGSSKTEDIVRFCHSRKDVKVYPKLYIAKKGKGVKLLFRMLFDKVCGDVPYCRAFGFMWEHRFSLKDCNILVPMWIGTYLSPYVYLGEDIDYLIEQLKPASSKFITTEEGYKNIKKYAIL